jgi:hypothetical protein
MLTDDEAEGYFCGMGTIGFVESVADLIFFDLPPNIAFPHLAIQQNGNKYGAFFNIG